MLLNCGFTHHWQAPRFLPLLFLWENPHTNMNEQLIPKVGQYTTACYFFVHTKPHSGVSKPVSIEINLRAVNTDQVGVVA
jgi:hypothetical protein